MPFSLIACQFSWETKSLMYACVCVCCAWGWVEWSEQNSFHHKSNATPAPLLEHWFVTIFHLIFSWSPIATKYADVFSRCGPRDRGKEKEKKTIAENQISGKRCGLWWGAIGKNEPWARRTTHTHIDTDSDVCNDNVATPHRNICEIGTNVCIVRQRRRCG